MTTANVERIKELLGSGLSNDVVATAVGVHPSYVTQLMSDEKFSAEVISLRTQTLTAATSRDRSWDSLEDKLLGRLDELVTSGMIYKVADVTRTLQVVNNAKRRGNPVQDTLVSNQQTVILNIPEVVVQSFSKTSANEVIEVEGRTLVTMPASALMQTLVDQNKGRKDYEQVRKYLPADTPTKT